MAGRQAKVLTSQQINTALLAIAAGRQPERNRVMFLLSSKAGLRAKEIANLTWSMLTNAQGVIQPEIHLEDRAAKKRSGRTIPIAKELQKALSDLQELTRPQVNSHVIQSERGSNQLSANIVAQWFHRLYNRLGYHGCSSHSGRRTFITNCARKAALVGGSLRDVQSLAGHSSLQTTSRYIDINAEAKAKLVNMV